MEYLKGFELKHKIKVIYAAETGSRTFGTEVDTSDFDIHGFFVLSNDNETKEPRHIKNKRD
jgi:predicted nucleotidyltransferase